MAEKHSFLYSYMRILSERENKKCAAERLRMKNANSRC